MSDPVPIRRSPLRWVPLVLLILALPVLIFAGVKFGFARLTTASDTPGMVQLRIVGREVRGYAAKHDGHYPDALSELVDAGRLTPAQARCPDGHPYAYLGRGFGEQQVANGTVLAYEPAAANDDRGGAVLYADGTTTWLDRPDLTKAAKDDGPRERPPGE